MPIFKRPNDKTIKRDAVKGGATCPMGGLAGANGPFGTLFQAKRDGPFCFVVLPEGGIPAIVGTEPSEAECQVLGWDDQDLFNPLVTSVIVVKNPWNVATSGAGRKGLAMFLNGAWWIIQWECD